MLPQNEHDVLDALWRIKLHWVDQHEALKLYPPDDRRALDPGRKIVQRRPAPSMSALLTSLLTPYCKK